MKTILTEEVRAKVREYSRELRKWVSPERRRTKVQNMRAFLKGIGDLPAHRLCTDRSLGQVFDSEGRPIFAQLKRVNYSDESRFQWAIAYYVDERNQQVLVHKITATTATTATAVATATTTACCARWTR